MREYLLVFLVAMAVTYLLTVVAREIALRTGAVAQVRDRDVHDTPIPYLGGLAMLGGLAAAYVVAQHLPFLSRSQDFVFRDAGIVLMAGAVICAVGVLDDIFELDALTKFGGQVLAASLLPAFKLQFYYVPGSNNSQFILDPAQGAILTVVVVISTVNAVNFVDGLDGLAAGIVGIGAVAFFVFCYVLASQNELPLAITGALLTAALAGACAGFLQHNYHPARLFMGDSGSMLIGLVLSASAITLSGQFTGTEVASGGSSSFFVTFLPVVLPVSLLLLPVADLVLAVIRRTRAGRSPFAPDKEHLHHRLLEIGHSQRRAVIIMWMWAALVAGSAVLISLYSGRPLFLVLIAGFVVTLAATFVLPVISAPRHPAPGPLTDDAEPPHDEASGRPESAGTRTL